MNYIDMHVHSIYSDGTCTPSELVEEAERRQLSAFVLTDHDTVSGVEEAIQAAEGKEVKVFPGIELSALYKEQEIHILGYHIDIHNKNLLESLKQYQIERDKRNEKMIELLAKEGFDISVEKIKKTFPNAVITRAHLSSYLKEHNYVKSISEAFDKYLGKGCSCFIPKKGITVKQAVECIQSAGGRAVLAHPFLYHISWEKIQELTEYLVGVGLRGMEVLYYKNTEEEKKLLYGLTEKHHLFITGGSDFHGANKVTQMGIGYGDLRVPEALIANIV